MPQDDDAAFQQRLDNMAHDAANQRRRDAEKYNVELREMTENQSEDEEYINEQWRAHQQHMQQQAQQPVFQSMPGMGSNVYVKLPAPTGGPRAPGMYMNTNNVEPSMWIPPYTSGYPAAPTIGTDFEKLKAFFAEQLAPEQRALIMGLNPAPTPLSHAHVQQLKSNYENTYNELGLAKVHMCSLIEQIDEQEAIVNDLEECVTTKKLVWTDAEVALFAQVSPSAEVAPVNPVPTF